MASLDQVVQHIRFALETLSERNGHHDFEHLCRHFARHRISFNILPATGPVAGGGDQGRDFETFRTFIHGEPNRFCAVAHTQRLAFACSLETRVVEKLRSDVAKIMEGAQRPNVVYFFSSHPVKVSDRHKQQEWAKNEYDLALEVLDREALAEQLADPEIFWIAARYLDIPLEIFPKPAKANSECERLRDKWFAKEANPQRYADFIEIKRAARHALDEVPQDLSRWIELLVKCEANRSGTADARQVTYEVIALTVRQTRSLRGQEERIRRFFRETGVPKFPDTAVEAETVHSYASTAQHMDEAALTKQELDSWHAMILDAVKTGLASPASANQLCQWLRLRGEMNLNEQIRSGTRPDLSDSLVPWLQLTNELPCSCLPSAGFSRPVIAD